MRVIIDIPKDSYKATICENMTPPDVKNVVVGIKNGIQIPDNATNGDVIKALFPSERDEHSMTPIHLMYDGLDFVKEFRREWWNAPYKEG